jgi:hypothetical protein
MSIPVALRGDFKASQLRALARDVLGGVLRAQLHVNDFHVV